MKYLSCIFNLNHCILKINLSFFESGPVDCHFQGYQDKNINLRCRQYTAWPDCIDEQAGLALYWQQNLSVIAVSKVHVQHKGSVIFTFQGLASLLRLWYHESCRVFQDRLVNDEDRDWFDDLLKTKMKSDFSAKVEEVINNDLILYGDMLSTNVDSKVYGEIVDHAKVGHNCC